MPHPTLTAEQLRDRLDGVAVLLREPCTPSDRLNARRILADTARQLRPTDVIGTPFVAAPFSLEALREADGADMLREVL